MSDALATIGQQVAQLHISQAKVGTALSQSIPEATEFAEQLERLVSLALRFPV